MTTAKATQRDTVRAHTDGWRDGKESCAEDREDRSMASRSLKPEGEGAYARGFGDGYRSGYEAAFEDARDAYCPNDRQWTASRCWLGGPSVEGCGLG
jgi:hypothetical protein